MRGLTSSPPDTCATQPLEIGTACRRDYLSAGAVRIWSGSPRQARPVSGESRSDASASVYMELGAAPTLCECACPEVRERLLVCGRATKMAAQIADEIGLNAPLDKAPEPVPALEAVEISAADDGLQSQIGQRL